MLLARLDRQKLAASPAWHQAPNAMSRLIHVPLKEKLFRMTLKFSCQFVPRPLPTCLVIVRKLVAGPQLASSFKFTPNNSALFLDAVFTACSGQTGTAGAWCAGGGRALHGTAAALAGVSGLALCAAAVPREQRDRALGALLGAVALGVLVGYPFGGATYALWSRGAPFLFIATAFLANLDVRSGNSPSPGGPDTKHECLFIPHEINTNIYSLSTMSVVNL
ncbi:hypothetical protein K1T71_000032 [Dendrolimus kikuchii]|uniref:Uncharacterized protein n=1 Tax=Dendrolimus kikuchii TaxID=765133 RepID=A0ACC1DIR2_9NEOP|nr:hypothetical protein K1T71_000032 [Dendrolimus kikuchii]